MSDAQLRLMEVIYHIPRMRLLEAYTSLLIWLLAAAWAYVCFGTDSMKISLWWFVLVVLALVVLRTWLQVRWARRTPDEQQTYMRENNIDTNTLSDAAFASRKDSANQLSEQKNILRQAALWAIPLAVALFLFVYFLAPNDLSSGVGQLLLLAAEDYIFSFCMTILVLQFRHRKK